MQRVLLYLALMIAASLGITLLFTGGQGWQPEELKQLDRQTDRKEPAFRTGPETVRPAAGAGSYYPANPEDLHRAVNSLLAGSPSLALGARAVLAPHAGYRYSGPVAAAAFRELDPDFNRVFILAANHNSDADFAGVSIPGVSHYAVPGGIVPVAAVVKELLEEPLFTSVPAAHTMYMVEAELPFLLALQGWPDRPDFGIVPLVVGRLTPEQAGRLATILSRYAGEDTRFVFSVDLSHFYAGEQARKLDGKTLEAILSRNRQGVARAITDGSQVLLTMVELAEKRNWDATLLDYRNSGQVTGDRERVVGYGSVAFHAPFRLGRQARRELLTLARRSIERHLAGDTATASGERLDRFPRLRTPRGVFVTLKKEGRLRGCIGEIISRTPLYQGVMNCAVKAAVKDSRFPPVTAEELPGLTLSISVLEFPRRLTVDDPAQYPQLLRPGTDGVILLHGGRQSTYLPQVWEQIPDPEEFLSRLCRKQASAPDCWRDPATVIYRYGAREFGES